MEAFFTKMWLQRRRLGVGAFLFFLFGLLDFGVLGDAGLVGTLVLSVVFALICTLIAAFSISMFPSYRQTFEVAGLGLLILAGLQLLWPTVFGDEIVFQTVWGMIGICLGYTVLNHVVYGKWWDKWGIRLTLSLKARLLFEASAEQIWNVGVPDAADPSRYYSGTLESFAEVDHAFATNRMRVKIGGCALQESFVRVTEYRPFEVHEMLSWWIEDDVQDDTGDCALSRLEFVERAGGTEVTFTEVNPSFDVASWLLSWFDNPVEQVLYSLRSKVEGSADPTYFGYLRKQVLDGS